MTALTRGMFGSEFNRAGNVFGIQCGQIRSNDRFHNASWYNRAGEKLGWGDLSDQDLARIARETTEPFYIVGEADSYWNLPDHLEPQNPGIDYVRQHVRAVITPGQVILITSERGKDGAPYTLGTLECITVLRERLTALDL